jgi:phage tail sheath protein FI
MVIPGVTDNSLGSVLPAATAFCEKKRAFLIMDPPRKDSADGLDPRWPNLIEDTMEDNSTIGETIPKSPNSAIYFPYLTSNDPITGVANNPITGLPYEIPPSGTVAGIFARTDQNRGVWKAPAGLETTLLNVSDVVERGQMTDLRQGVLNNDAINAIRKFPGIGLVVFGARTSVAQNTSFQQWKYVPVRRMALFIEQTLYANLGWVIFEPNDDPLWTAIRTSIEAFMLGLFNQQAFQGTTPSQAFQVKCDAQTTTQADIDNGIVNIVVAFAPLKPAEFVIIKITQLAGQTQTS